MAKSVVFDMQAREALKRGMDVLADAVRTTLGPRGRNVVLERKYGLPLVITTGTSTRTVASRRKDGPDSSS